MHTMPFFIRTVYPLLEAYVVNYMILCLNSFQGLHQNSHERSIRIPQESS